MNIKRFVEECRQSFSVRFLGTRNV